MTAHHDAILVTGASGFVGGAVVRRLSGEHSQSLVLALRSRTIAIPDSARAVEIAGLSANTDWSPALEAVATVVHCAARAHVMNEKSAEPLAEYRQVNVAGTLALAQQIGRAHV